MPDLETKPVKAKQFDLVIDSLRRAISILQAEEVRQYELEERGQRILNLCTVLNQKRKQINELTQEVKHLKDHTTELVEIIEDLTHQLRLTEAVAIQRMAK